LPSARPHLAGVVEFSEAARACGVRPILGARLRQGRQKATVLIGAAPGWHSLCRIISWHSLSASQRRFLLDRDGV